MPAALDFGSLNEHLVKSDPEENLRRSLAGDVVDYDTKVRLLTATPDTIGGYRNVMRSAGPVSDAYILSTEPFALLEGPRGSGKTTASVKKGLVEAQRIWPGPDGIRRYKLGVWREKYTNLWDATIPSYWKVLPKDLAGSTWSGSKPHPAQHVVRFEDGHGHIEMTTVFYGFGELADPDDLLGKESTDAWLNQPDTLDEILFTWLVAVVGREPPWSVIKRQGRFFGDQNAPTPLHWTYRDFHESPKEGYELYRQPGGREPDAENIETIGRAYYDNLVKLNAHRQWWIKIQVDNKPGFRRDADTPYFDWDDVAMMSPETLEFYPQLPLLVGEDGGLTPAAVYMQIMPNGQRRILAEVPIERGSMKELSGVMLELEAARFHDAEFVDRCDPSMIAGEDVDKGSDRKSLAGFLGREVTPARTNNLGDRHDAVKEGLVIKGGIPMTIVDPSCKVLRRGFNGAYRYEQVRGTTDRGAIKKDFTTHVHDALQCVALESGFAVAQKRKTDMRQARERRREEARERGRFSPAAFRRGRG